MSRKRHHCNDRQGWWQQAVEWVESNGGTVHSDVKISDDRQLYVENAHNKGTELFRIPFACLVCKVNIEATNNGQQFIQAIEKVGDDKLYSPLHDVVLAIYLASFPSTLSGSTTVEEDTVFRPYLNTLPEQSTFHGLPRLWSEDDLKYLGGSPVLQRVKNQKKGIENDYRLVRDEWKKLGNTDESFPSWEAFNYRLAAVSSRAFAGFGSFSNDKNNSNDMNIALVPLLDLCNHCRGKSETKNLSYCQQQSTTTTDMMIIVTTSQDITAGESLRITYGARSNAQLLLNYGFCIPDNIESDGSSNDVLEFVSSSSDIVFGSAEKDDTNNHRRNKSVVELRTGPKAHAFYGFVNALDRFSVNVVPIGQQPQGDDDKDENDDFDANEQEFARWDMDMTKDMMDSMGKEQGDDEEEEEEEDEEEDMKEQNKESIEEHFKSLTLLESRLKELQVAYHLQGNKLKEALGASSMVNKRHAALLVLSENRTIYFVLCIIRQLRCLMGLPGNNSAINQNESVESLMTEADKNVLSEQAQQIASAFIAIRLSR
jgi:SET domain